MRLLENGVEAVPPLPLDFGSLRLRSGRLSLVEASGP